MGVDNIVKDVERKTAYSTNSIVLLQVDPNSVSQQLSSKSVISSILIGTSRGFTPDAWHLPDFDYPETETVMGWEQAMIRPYCNVMELLEGICASISTTNRTKRAPNRPLQFKITPLWYCYDGKAIYEPRLATRRFVAIYISDKAIPENTSLPEYALATHGTACFKWRTLRYNWADFYNHSSDREPTPKRSKPLQELSYVSCKALVYRDLISMVQSEQNKTFELVRRLSFGSVRTLKHTHGNIKADAFSPDHKLLPIPCWQDAWSEQKAINHIHADHVGDFIGNTYMDLLLAEVQTEIHHGLFV